MKVYYYTLVNILFFIILISCKEQNKNTAIITFTTGIVTVNKIPVPAGKLLNINDTIKTDNNSYATIQIGNTIVITVKDNTEIQIRKTNIYGTEKDCSIDIHYGYIFNKLTQGMNHYSIHTPTIVASVRGTSFAVSCDQKTGNSSTKLLKGNLNVTAIKESDKFTIDMGNEGINLFQGEKIDFTEGIAVNKSSMTSSEIEELERFDMIQPVTITNKIINTENKNRISGNKPSETTAISEIQKDQITRAIPRVNSSGINQKQNQTYQEILNEIKIQNHGQLDVLNLKDGRRIKGMLQERGMIYRIKTPSGVIDIPGDEVASQTIIK